MPLGTPPEYKTLLAMQCMCLAPRVCACVPVCLCACMSTYPCMCDMVCAFVFVALFCV